MTPILSVHTVSKAYPGEKLGAVNNVSFEMQAGEVLSFVGESGSGKSTLLHMLAGLLKPDVGEIVFQGIPLENPEEQLIAGNSGIKMVFQDFDLMPSMTVAENLRYPLLVYDKEYTKERVQELLELCNIEDLAARLPNELSGGQQQRVALARALADEPELLLMDEPFSQLDPINKSQLLREVLRIIKAAGVGLVFVTHDTRDALMISDRIAFLKAGVLEQEGSPIELYRNPGNLEIARFFGDINVFYEKEIDEYLPALKKQLEMRKAKAIGVRAENVTLETKAGDISLLISEQQVFFLGDRFTIEGELKGGKVIVLETNHSPLKTKGDILVSFCLQELLYFY